MDSRGVACQPSRHEADFDHGAHSVRQQSVINLVNVRKVVNCRATLVFVIDADVVMKDGVKADVAEVSGCATLKLGRCPTRLPVVLESAAELAASEGDNGIGSADRPEHTGLFEPAQNRFAACLDDSRAHK